MHGQPSDCDQPRRGHDEQAAAEVAIISMLVHDPHQGPWTQAEVEREIGEEIVTRDALNAMHRSGLIHLHGDLVIASRAAQRMSELPF